MTKKTFNAAKNNEIASFRLASSKFTLIRKTVSAFEKAS